METISELSQVTMTFLCYRCEEETERFFLRKTHDPRYCYELFRRAIVERDEFAWHCLYHRYRKLVGGWAEHHHLYSAINEDSEALVNAAFEKMWQVMSPEKFARFPDLKSILRYLQLCLGSVIIDLARAAERLKRLEEVETDREKGQEEGASEEPASGDLIEDQIFYQREAEEMWRLLSTRLKNDKERQVLYGIFVLALKPAELQERFPGTFRNVREVYLVKDNLLERLRRDTELKAFYESQ